MRILSRGTPDPQRREALGHSTERQPPVHSSCRRAWPSRPSHRCQWRSTDKSGKPSSGCRRRTCPERQGTLDARSRSPLRLPNPTLTFPVCSSARTMCSSATFGSSAFNHFLKVSKSSRCHTHRIPQEEINIPFALSSLEMRSCPQASFPGTIRQTASSTSGATRFFGQGLRRVSSCRAS
jgi:hypothetical protein